MDADPNKALPKSARDECFMPASQTGEWPSVEEAISANGNILSEAELDRRFHDRNGSIPWTTLRNEKL